MFTPFIQIRSFIFALTLVVLPPLLGGCGQIFIDSRSRLWAIEDEIATNRAAIAVQATRVSVVEGQANAALAKAEQALALVGATPTATPTIITLPFPGTSVTIEGGVAISRTQAGLHRVELYPLTENPDDLKIYSKGQWSTFTQGLTESERASSTTILFAVVSSTEPDAPATLYAAHTAQVAQGRQVWQEYSTQTTRVQASNGLSRTETSVLFGGTALVISDTVSFPLSPTATLNDSLLALQGALREQNATTQQIKRLLLRDPSQGTPRYLLVFFTDDDSGAGNDRVCVWCTRCGSACGWVCRRVC